MKDTRTIGWNRAKLTRFRKAYHEAASNMETRRSDVFTFDGYEYVVGYAFYLIEYLNGALP